MLLDTSERESVNSAELETPLPVVKVGSVAVGMDDDKVLQVNIVVELRVSQGFVEALNDIGSQGKTRVVNIINTEESVARNDLARAFVAIVQKKYDEPPTEVGGELPK